MSKLIAVLVLAGTISCSRGDGLPTGPSPVSTTLEIHYQATAVSTARSDDAGALVDCAERARIHPSWWGFAQASVPSSGPGSWSALFENVPIGPQVIRVGAPPGCETVSVVVNGTPLTAQVGLAGGDIAYAFTVHSDGSVSP